MRGENIQTNHAKLRVGVVTTSFPITGHVSSGVFVERLVAHLPQTVAATVLTPCSDSKFVARPDSPYRLKCFTYGPRGWMRLAHKPGGIPDALRRRDPAVLLLPVLLPAMFIACLRLAGRSDILHGNWSVSAVIAAIAARLRGRAAVATLRGEDIIRAESSRLFRLILSLCLALNHRTIVVSEAMRETLCRRYPRWASRIEFIPNGVSIPKLPPRTGFHVPLRLVVVASLIQRKRIDTLIRAMAEFAENNSVLRIVGDGALRRDLEALSHELGVAQRVEFVGNVPPEEVERHLRWADIFVFASESEGRPNAVLEAMASGLPVVATDLPGITEIVVGSGAGKVFPVGDEVGLAGALHSILESSATYTAFASAGPDWLRRNRLTWEACAERYAASFHSVVA